MESPALEHIARAPNKDFVRKILTDAFMFKEDLNSNTSAIKLLCATLDIDQNEALKVLKELSITVKKVIFDGLSDVSSIQTVIDERVSDDLKRVLAVLILEQLPKLKRFVVENQSIVPKLVDFDWRVDIKMQRNLGGTEIKSGTSGQQTCILQFQNHYTKHDQTKSFNQLDDYFLKNFSKLAKKQLAILSFSARTHPNDKCGNNGLPLTPNSIRAYGRFQCLKCLNQPNLCRYVEIQRGNHERLNVISESYSLKLSDLINDNYMYNFITIDSNLAYKWTIEILSALKYLHENDVTIKCFNLKNILITSNMQLKIANYGLFYMTECGYCVDFPIGYPLYTSPECFLIEFLQMNKHIDHQNSQYWQINNPKIDIWSLGVIILRFIYGVKDEEFEKISVKKVAEDMIDFIRKAKLEKNSNLDAYLYFIQLFKIEPKKQEIIESRWKSLVNLIKDCLKINIKKRPTAKQLMSYLNNEVQINLKNLNETYDKDHFKNRIFNNLLRTSLITFNNTKNENQDAFTQDYHNLWMRGIDQVYYLWRLTGGDCTQIIRQNNKYLFQLPSILKTSILFTVDDSCEHGVMLDYEIAYDDKLIPISLNQLKDRLNSIKDELYFNEIESDIDLKKTFLNITKIQAIQSQPLNIRETDIEYQSYRIALLSFYLYAYPFKKNELYQECRIDIPPHYRALAWAALLEVNEDIEEIYANINKEIITPTDRQIEVDVPRCHQYDILTASPEAHYKLKRILKAWVLSNPNLVYWQGLDSLCAPFLYLNFNNEAVAYGCLNNFVQKYATKFFLKDNSNVINEYLAAFSHLTAFHDPELSNHFEMIEFRPDLYAIPWFLTMFAHVFPLHKIFHLWDTLLLGSSEFPLCIGVAILRQLRNILLNSDFNECILLFSELPEINIEKCVTDSLKIFLNTPNSCLYLQYLNSDSITNREMKTIDLKETRMEICPRIGLKNLITLLDSKPSKALVIDIRKQKEENFNNLMTKKNVLTCENLNFSKLSTLSKSSDKLFLQQNENEPNNMNLINFLNQNENLVKAIVPCNKTFEDAIKLANILVKLGYSKICILNNYTQF